MKRMSLILGFLWLCGAGSVQAADVLQSALEYNRTNEATTWVDPDSGQSGSTVPTRTFEGAAGQPCREFMQTVTIGGQPQQAYGTACRQPDGSWHIVGDQPETAQVVVREPRVIYREPPGYVYYRPYPVYRPYYPYYYPFFSPISLSLSFGHVHWGRHRWGRGWRW
ncbi:MAG: hypothetical protein HY900_02050 [Deltaproteobacteria bacterium]|nr:hypothetical protein [Deltaproteobacteria bacterium]